MGKGTVNWDDVETWQRLVASIIASGVKLDLKNTALYFGTTYDSLENKMRKVKKEAIVLKQEVETGQRGEVAPTRTKSANTTPKKSGHSTTNTPKKSPLDNVANGRISKPSPARKTPAMVKQEALSSATSSSSFFDDFEIGPDSFDTTGAAISFNTSFADGDLSCSFGV